MNALTFGFSFRARERQLIAELMRGAGQLVATGGGAVVAEENRHALRTRAFVVWLQVTVPRQLERLARDRSRPLLAVPDREARLDALAADREPLYREVADFAFESDGLAVPVAAERLAGLLQHRWQRTEAA